jgi:hypothetical protein
MDTIWNLEPDTDADTNTDNCPDPEVLKFEVFVTLKYIYRWSKY